MKAIALAAISGCYLMESLALDGCSAGRNHTPDSALERNFRDHEREFEALLHAVEGDSKLTMIGPGCLRYGGRQVKVYGDDISPIYTAGFSQEAWIGYQKQLGALGLKGGVLKSEGRVEFRVDPGSIANGDSYKGYEYRATPPQRLRESLDGFRISEGDRSQFGGYVAYKHLKGRWYLYIFAN